MMDWLKCNICFDTYNESSLRPRSLICGHTFCERCLNNTIQNKTLICPQCRKIHEINSVVDLPINFIVEGLLKSLNTSSQDLNEGAISSHIEGNSDIDEKSENHGSLKSFLDQQERSLSAQKELLKTSAGLCNDHPSNECMYRCSSHKCWVCNQCIEDQEDHPKHKCKITSFNDELEVRRQNHKRSLEEEGQLCDETSSVIEKHISCLKNEKESHISLVDILQDLVNLHKKKEENLENEIVSFQNVIEKGKNLKQSLQNAGVTVLNTVTLDESNASRDLVKNKKAETRSWINTFKKEVDDGKLKMENATFFTMAKERSLEYVELCRLLHQELQENIKKSEQTEFLADRNKSDNIQLTREDTSQSKLQSNDVANLDFLAPTVDSDDEREIVTVSSCENKKTDIKSEPLDTDEMKEFKQETHVTVNYKNRKDIEIKQAKTLYMETQLLNLDKQIRDALNVNDPRQEDAKQCLEKMSKLTITASMLETNLDVVNTIKSCRRYKYGEEVRNKAEIVYNKFKEVKNEDKARNQVKSDALSAIFLALKGVTSWNPSHETAIFRLKIILRILQISPFNDEKNTTVKKEEWLTVDQMTGYLMEDLDNFRDAQHANKHDVFIENTHELLNKLAGDFSPERMDNLFGCFIFFWSSASERQRETVLELIRQLIEGDKDGALAYKVLLLLWSIAQSADLSTNIMNQALNLHLKILNYASSQVLNKKKNCGFDSTWKKYWPNTMQKSHWLNRFVEDLKHNKWFLPALQQIKNICCSYSVDPEDVDAQGFVVRHFHQQRRHPHGPYRHKIISELHKQHLLVGLIINNLTEYMKTIRCMAKENPNMNPAEIFPDGRFNHITQVQERLSMLQFMHQEGRGYLYTPSALEIWNCLVENAVFPIDRETCFIWFSMLLRNNLLDPEDYCYIFENTNLQLDPSLLSENGIKCYENLFKKVNIKEKKLMQSISCKPSHWGYLLDMDLIGVDYMWRIILYGSEEISIRASEFLREIFTYPLGSKLEDSKVLIHDKFLSSCISHLETIDLGEGSISSVHQETAQMGRILKVFYEYVCECDYYDYYEDILALRMASEDGIYSQTRLGSRGAPQICSEAWKPLCSWPPL